MKKKYYKKTVVCLIISFLLCWLFVNLSYGANGTVKDNNNANEGQILVATGTQSGKNNDIGTWVNPSDVPGLKGDTGEQGIAGINGIAGKNGIDGKAGINGIDGEDFNKHTRKEAELEVQFIRGKNITVGVYGKTGDYKEIGVRVTVGIGKSWTGKKIEELERKLEKIK